MEKFNRNEVEMSKICMDISDEEFTEISAALLRFETDLEAVEEGLTEHSLYEMSDYFTHRALLLKGLRIKLYEAWARREGS
uniref:Uncharacterized protein n=1 Tax=viral metagenome TaxID=1070528 RepID=A0A6M3M317_9ZZZZ